MKTNYWIKALSCVMIVLGLNNQIIKAQCTTPVIYPRMGVNLDGYPDYYSYRQFTDFAKEGNFRNTNWSNYSGTYDSNGWPTQAFIFSLLECNCLPVDFQGTYLIQYKGPTSAISSTGGENPVTNIINVGNGYTQATTVITSYASLTFNTGVSDIQIIPTVLNGKPTGYTLTNFPVFPPIYVNTYKSFTLYRFMDWSNTNTNTIINWSDRPLPASIQSSSYGVAYENMIALCNESDKDMWINIPVLPTMTMLNNLPPFS